MTDYAIEHRDEREGTADGPYRTGVYGTLDEAKRAGELFATRDGPKDVVIRDSGESTSFGAGTIVSEWDGKQWRDCGPTWIANWWPAISEPLRTHLREHPHEALKSEQAVEVSQAGGIVVSEAWWFDRAPGPDGFYLNPSEAEWARMH